MGDSQLKSSTDDTPGKHSGHKMHAQPTTSPSDTPYDRVQLPVPPGQSNLVDVCYDRGYDASKLSGEKLIFATSST